MEFAEKVCNLECVEKDHPVIEFVGPVKVVLVNPSQRMYHRKTYSAVCIALANMLIGATTITVLFFILTFKLKLLNNLHVLLCTIGYQLCMPSAILMLNSLNGASGPLKMADRKYLHLLLQCFGFGCVCAGSALPFLSGGNVISKITIHSVAGLAAGGFAVLSVITGLTVYNVKGERAHKVSKKCHNIYGILTFVISSACFIFGISLPSFRTWMPVSELTMILTLFCVFYTTVVIFIPAFRFVKKFNYF